MPMGHRWVGGTAECEVGGVEGMQGEREGASLKPCRHANQSETTEDKSR